MGPAFVIYRRVVIIRNLHDSIPSLPHRRSSPKTDPFSGRRI